MITLDRVTTLAHRTVGLVTAEGDYVVDATAGNGHDTVFLAELVGTTGRVYAFDVQQGALDNTARELQNKGFQDRVTLICAGHEQLERYISVPLAAVMYNLGYLPGGDHRISTHHQTTLVSLEQALKLLQPGGVITVTLYPGHEQGAVEKEELLTFCRNLSAADYVVLHTRICNRQGPPPELLVVQKTFSEPGKINKE